MEINGWLIGILSHPKFKSTMKITHLAELKFRIILIYYFFDRYCADFKAFPTFIRQSSS